MCLSFDPTGNSPNNSVATSEIVVRAPGPVSPLKGMCCSVLQRVAVCYSVLQCVAVCCSVLQCIAVCCSML